MSEFKVTYEPNAEITRLREALIRAEARAKAYADALDPGEMSWKERAEKAESELSSMRAVVEAAQWFMRNHAKECNCGQPGISCLGPIDAMREALAALVPGAEAGKEPSCHPWAQFDKCPKCNPPAKPAKEGA